jgi:acetyltransferase EpsM
MKIILIGNGGHSKVIQDMINALRVFEIIAILDDKYQYEQRENGIIHAPLTFIEKLIDRDIKVLISIGNNEIRKAIAIQLNLNEEAYVTVIHPTAIISPSARIGLGTVIMPNAVVNAESVIGDHCIINTGAIIEHENQIGNYAHVSPNATLTGNVTIGEGSHIGASATVIPGRSIGEWSIVGAGSTVIHNIPSNSKVVGSPTRSLKEARQIVL